MHTGESGEKAEEAVKAPPEVRLALIGGLGMGGKLRENRCITLTATGAIFTGDPTLEQWREGLQAVRWLRTSGDLICADFLRKGRELFGVETVNLSLVQLEFNLLDAQRAIAIAGLASTVERVGLTSDHLVCIAEAELLELQQVYWAGAAVEHRLTVQELRRSIVAGEVLKGRQFTLTGGTRITELASPHAVAQAFMHWRRQVDPLTLPEATQREVFGELQESARTAVALAQALGLDLRKELGV